MYVRAIIKHLVFHLLHLHTLKKRNTIEYIDVNDIIQTFACEYNIYYKKMLLICVSLNENVIHSPTIAATKLRLR